MITIAAFIVVVAGLRAPTVILVLFLLAAFIAIISAPLLFWGWVLGPVGMLLSVHLTITAKIALGSREDTRWVAVMLGPEVTAKEKIETPDESSGEDND